MKQEIKENKNSVFQIIDDVTRFEESLINDKPLDEEAKKRIGYFNGLSMEKILNRNTREDVLKEIKTIKEILEDQKVTKAINDGISIVQSLVPSVRINPFPIYLIYAGGMTDAKAMLDGIVFNFGMLIHLGNSTDEILELIKSITAHETVHRVLDQLGIQRDEESSLNDDILDDVWEEGLATYVQTVQYDSHHILSNDYKFYAQIMNEWLNSPDDSKKKEMIDKMLGRESFRKFLENQGDWYTENVLECEDIDTKFHRMMIKSNGPVYHLGYMLWKERIDKGEDIEKLIKGGYKQVREWLKE